MGVFAWSISFLAAGFYLAFYAFTSIELNDRIKYEAAYLKGYAKVQERLQNGEVEKAKEFLDFYIDAHVKTLSDFSFLESSLLVDDINEVLCDVVTLRKEYPRIRNTDSDNLSEWHQSIDNHLRDRGYDC